MKLWILILVLAIIAPPVQAGSCAMGGEKSQETMHHMDGMEMDHSDHERHPCCESDESDPADECDGNMNCGPCFVAVSMVSTLARVSAEFLHQAAPAVTSGVILPSHTSPPFKPPIS